MIIRIHNSIGRSDRLYLFNDHWQKAVKKEHLNYSAFCLYLFLAGHQNKEKIEMNKEIFEESTGYKKTAYNDAIRTLREKGYLIQIGENRFDFYTSPHLVDGKIPPYMFGED